MKMKTTSTDDEVLVAFRKINGRAVRKLPPAASAAGRRRLEAALCTISDYEGEIKTALCLKVGDGASDYDHVHVCAAMRILVDGE